jgi:hypothetical protein
MNALPSHPPLLYPPAGRAVVSLDELADCVSALDPGSRALLDLSLRRRLSLESMAGVLHTDPFDLARRRARAVARIAADLDLEGRGVIAAVRAALARLPEDAWGVPLPVRPRPVVQAEPMADAARALMEKLRVQRERAREASATAAAAALADAADPNEQPTVEMEAVVLPEAASPARRTSMPPSDMAAAFAGHPAFAVEVDAAEVAFAVRVAGDAPSLPPLAEALARAAASERAATQEQPAVAAVAAPIQAPSPAPAIDRPAATLTVPPTVEQQPRRRLARNGLLLGLLLAIARFLLGRR